MEHFLSVENLEKIFHEKIEHKAGKGIDGLPASRFAVDINKQTEIITRKLLAGSFKFSPYLEKLFSKGRNKAPRVISIPTVRDRVVLSALLEYIQSNLPQYVPKKLPNTYILEIKKHLRTKTSDRYSIIKADIKNFYPSIPHTNLLALLAPQIEDKTILDLIEKAIKTPTVAKGTHKSEYSETIESRGVPQGLSISNVLAEIYLSKIDALFDRADIKYWRFVDDILIICSCDDAQKHKEKLEEELSRIGLETNSKSECYDNGAKFSFLGYVFDGDKVTVSKKSMESFIQKITEIFNWYNSTRKSNLEVAQNALIDMINEKITGAINENKRYGWLFYYSEIDTKHILFMIDHIIQKRIKKLPEFKGKTPKKLKTMVRAYHEVKYSPDSGYVHDYNAYKTKKEMFDFLQLRAVIPQTRKTTDYGKQEVIRLFYRYRNSQLSRLHRDIGIIS